jgi:hypothetical protein
MDNYRLYDLETRSVIVTKDATFHENTFPYKEEKPAADIQSSSTLDLLPYVTSSIPPRPTLPSCEPGVESAQFPATNPFESVSVPRRSRRLQNLPPIHASLCALSVEDSSFPTDPKSIQEAYSRPDAHLWKDAVKDQLDSLVKNDTWTLVPLPPGKRVVIPIWVFTVKRDGKGNIIKYKARCVANGKTQQWGVDYFETFSPVVKLPSIRILLAWACQSGYISWHFDIKSAYLYGQLDEEVYMKPPPGYDCPPHLVCKLQKSIYGLKQAARTWNTLLNSTLTKLGYKRFYSDTGIYKRTLNGKLIYLAIWVDDILLLCPDVSSVKIVREELRQHFETSDLGEATFLLGINIIRKGSSLFLHQHFYLENLLHSTGMADCNPVATPLPLNYQTAADFTENVEPLDTKIYPYRQILGSLMYAMVATRPDLAFAVTVLSKTMQNPRWCDWLKLKHVLRYIKGTLDYALHYNSNCSSPELVQGYSDADWGSDPSTRRSFAGFIFLMANGAISWKTKHHPTAATSSGEAETISLAYATSEALWIRNFLLEMEITPAFPLLIHCDNQAAITFTQHPICDGKLKHIDIKFHFVRDYVSAGKIKIQHVPTQGMIADIFTKVTPKDTLRRCLHAANILPYSSANVTAAISSIGQEFTFNVVATDALELQIPLQDDLRSDILQFWCSLLATGDYNDDVITAPLRGGVDVHSVQSLFIASDVHFDSIDHDKFDRIDRS